MQYNSNIKISDIVNITNSSIKDTSYSDIEIEKMNTLDDANDRELSFFHNSKYKHMLKDTKAKAVLIKKEEMEYLPKDTIAIINDNPYLAMAKMSKVFFDKIKKPTNKPDICKSSNIYNNTHIGNNSHIGENTIIMSGAFIGDNVHIGDNCTVYPNVVIYDNTFIDDNTVIHANCTIGSDGFGYTADENINPIKIYHMGRVKIGKNVEIGANTTIDRAVFSETFIDDWCKIDNLVHIGHNCRFGKKTAVASSCCFAGSAIVGSGVFISGNTTVNGHISICDGVQVGGHALILRSIEKTGHYNGVPITEHKKWLKQVIKQQKS